MFNISLSQKLIKPRILKSLVLYWRYARYIRVKKYLTLIYLAYRQYNNKYISDIKAE